MPVLRLKMLQGESGSNDTAEPADSTEKNKSGNNIQDDD